MILGLACALAVAVSVGAFVLAQRQTGSQPLPGRADGGQTATQRLPLPGRLLYLGALAVLVGVTAVLIWSVDGGESQPPPLPGETVLVIDVSGSITLQGNRLIARTLAGFRNYPPDRHAAVVYFSSTAALASPPSAPASELSGLTRFFVPNKAGTRGPWAASFDGGTRISHGIALARRVLERAHVRDGRVVLLSDLRDNPKDLPRLNKQLLLLQKTHASLEVLPLPATRGSPLAVAELSAPYRAVFGDGIIVSKPNLVAGVNGEPVRQTAIDRPRQPTVALLLALILAASTLAVSFFPRLAWRLG